MAHLYVLVRLDIDADDGSEPNESDAVAFVLDGLTLLSPVDSGTVGVEAVALSSADALRATGVRRDRPFVL